MAAQQAVVIPVGTLWAVKVSGRTIGDVHRTQESAINAARRWLEANGGGELVVLGEDGQIRQKDTIGRPDPRNIPG